MTNFEFTFFFKGMDIFAMGENDEKTLFWHAGADEIFRRHNARQARKAINGHVDFTRGGVSASNPADALAETDCAF
jgi:hypothetical protein